MTAEEPPTGSGPGSGTDSGSESAGAEWPVDVRGVTESVVTTLGPNDRWNVAALGLHELDAPGGPVSAVTFGNTRTRRNFHREGGGYVQFTTDPVLYVEAALSIREQDDPVLESAAAWVRVQAEHVDTEEADGTDGTDGRGETDGADETANTADTRGTTLEHWHLHPVESEVVREAVPTTNRGYNAVVEATVAASRLGVDAYDTDVLRDRLTYLEEVCRTCGGAREQAAFDRLNELVDR